jgi:hypothetical protein
VIAPTRVSAEPCARTITFANASGSLKSPSITTPEPTDCAMAREKLTREKIKRKKFFILKIKK